MKDGEPLLRRLLGSRNRELRGSPNRAPESREGGGVLGVWAVEDNWGWAGSRCELRGPPLPTPTPREPRWCCMGWQGQRCWRTQASPVHHESRGVVAHGGRVQRPPAAGQLAGLDGVVAHGGQPVTPWLPGQQHAARLHVLLLHHRLAGGLWAVWEGRRGMGQGSQRCRGRGASLFKEEKEALRGQARCPLLHLFPCTQVPTASTCGGSRPRAIRGPGAGEFTSPEGSPTRDWR